MALTNREMMKRYYQKPLSRLKSIYNAMYARCYKKSNISYKRYGMKGITICDEWLNNPQAFYDWSLINGFEYKPNENNRNTLSIDRIDNSKGYSPDNCRWVNNKVQRYHRKIIKFIEYNGQKKTLRDWCKELNLKYPQMYYRIHFKNMTLEQAMKCQNIKFRNKNTKSNNRFIYVQKDGSYSVQIKRKYYGRSKNLQEAIKIRDLALKDLGLLNDLNELELKGEVEE